ncbi:MAG: extracellular solute-binding protein [Clostridia bacterium]|nr:extracellular solute-binding protein [Clostridia bacterium]
MKIKYFRKLVSLMLSLVLILGTFSACKESKVAMVDLSAYLTRVDNSTESNVIGYSTYINQFNDNKSTENILITVANEQAQCLIGDTLVYQFDVEVEGLYSFCAEITGGSSTLSDYYGSLKLDGEYPFSECEQIYFSKRWINEGEFNKSKQSELTEDKNYISTARSDRSYEAGELYFYLQKGTHSIEFTASNQSLNINKLYFEGKLGYFEIKGNPRKTDAKTVLVQAENPTYRSKSSILEQIDRTSAATIPVCLDRATYNTLGGNSWKTIGESVTWKMEVNTDGWYCLNLRVRQDYSAGAVSCRRLLIDGKEINENASEITIPYSTSWQKFTLSDKDGEPIYMYLKSGTHTVSLECSLGSLSQVVPIVESSITECNRIYRRIIMITGTNPDLYRDYNLDEKLPDVIESIKTQRETLNAVADYLSALGDGGESDAAVFRKLIRQFDEFLQDADSIPSQISTLSSNISAIGTWQLECTNQPLEIDWLELQAFGDGSTDTTANFFKQFGHSATRIIKSYSESYNDISNTEIEKSVDVWAVTGRDQIQLIENLCHEFTAKEEIGVNLKLVSGDSVMAATVAGIGPDVTLFNGAPNVISYAIRKATVDLSKLDGFDECTRDFYESAIVPYRFNGGVYALPETQSFPMLFYRKDILEELELEVPTTWDEAYDCITTLQKNNMTFGCPTYDVFLYQHGGSYYNEKGSVSYMNSEESVNAFKTWTKFYTNFNLPLSYNFINRFRSGEMPIAIADYSSYNSLVVFAPEISGSWGMTMVPGTKNADGTVDHSVSAAGTAAMIFSNTDDIDSSWKFLKWWVSGQTQSDYAIGLETKLGASARVMVASKSAFETLDWTDEQKSALKQQWNWVDGTPEVPGGYLMSRHINNAFRKIVYNDADLRETLGEYKVIIDKELTLKREEYGLE